MAAVIAPTNKPQDLQRRGTTTATLTIPSRTGHRRTLLDYFVKAASSDFSDLSVGNVKLLRLYDNLAQAVFVSDAHTKFQKYGFLWYLSTIIPDFPFPTAAQDEDITIARNSGPTRIDGYYRDAVEGDVTSHNVPGGSLSTKQLFIVNLNNGTAVGVAATGFNFDTLDEPAGLTPFSEGTDIVAAGRRIAPNQRLTIYAIAGDFPKTGTSKTTRVHILEEQTELFTSENAEGLLADPDNGEELAFSLSSLHAFVLPTPYVMNPNVLYSFKADASMDGADQLAIGTQKLFLICMREYITGGA